MALLRKRRRYDTISVSSRAEGVRITDDYIFAYAMRQPGVCERMIECLLPGMKVAKVVFKDEPEDAGAVTQKTIQGNLGMHSVRLDVYLDDGERVFNLEMQTGDKHNLPKRVRFYGGRIDCDQLEQSQDYNQLRPTYIIFICTFDPFGADQYHYTFENTCTEVPGMKLKDESYKLFFNATGHKGTISSELKALLDYFRAPENLPANEQTALVRKLDDIVDYANRDKDWRRGYMTFAQAQMDARNEGIDIGKNIGKKIGKDIGLREAAVSLYKNGMTKSTIAQMLGYPLATIERWIKQEETEHADL